MVRSIVAYLDRSYEQDLADDGRRKAESWATKAEMARPGERRFGHKPDDDRDGREPRTLACHDPSRYTTQCRGG